MSIYTSTSDFELLQKVAEYDSKALEELYDRYSSLLYTLIKSIVKEEETSEEILSDVFVIIWGKINKYDFSNKNVYTWLITLAHNKAVDALRRSRGELGIQDYSDEYENDYIIPKLSMDSKPVELNDVVNMKEEVNSALNNLTDAQKYVIQLAYYEGLSEKQIADKLKIPLPTVKSKLKIALSNLKDNLFKEEA